MSTTGAAARAARQCTARCHHPLQEQRRPPLPRRGSQCWVPPSLKRPPSLPTLAQGKGFKVMRLASCPCHNVQTAEVSSRTLHYQLLRCCTVQCTPLLWISAAHSSHSTSSRDSCHCRSANQLASRMLHQRSCSSSHFGPSMATLLSPRDCSKRLTDRLLLPLNLWTTPLAPRP